MIDARGNAPQDCQYS